MLLPRGRFVGFEPRPIRPIQVTAWRGVMAKREGEAGAALNQLGSNRRWM